MSVIGILLPVFLSCSNSFDCCSINASSFPTSSSAVNSHNPKASPLMISSASCSYSSDFRNSISSSSKSQLRSVPSPPMCMSLIKNTLAALRLPPYAAVGVTAARLRQRPVSFVCLRLHHPPKISRPTLGLLSRPACHTRPGATSSARDVQRYHGSAEDCHCPLVVSLCFPF